MRGTDAAAPSTVFVKKPAPEWRADAVVNGEFKKIALSDYKGMFVTARAGKARDKSGRREQGERVTRAGDESGQRERGERATRAGDESGRRERATRAGDESGRRERKRQSIACAVSRRSSPTHAP